MGHMAALAQLVEDHPHAAAWAALILLFLAMRALFNLRPPGRY